MTRREEIVTATLGCRQNYVDLKRPITPDDVADAFEKGAYWADKTMIEKACQWIESYLFDIGFPDDWCRDSATMKSGKQRFLEAMEE
jgi:hypothetical protein